MFINYIRIAFRAVRKNKVSSFINIAGLSVSLAIVLLIASFIEMEFSIDKFHKNYEHIYKIGKETTPAPVADIIKLNVPDIKKVTRVESFRTQSVTMKYNKNPLTVTGLIFSDPDFFDIFTFKPVEGYLKEALQEPMTVVLTKSTANRIFGKESPINKVIKLDNRYELTVKAIIEDVPSNSSIWFSSVASFSSIKDMNPQAFEWGNRNYFTYFLAPPDLNKHTLQKEIQNVIKKNAPEGSYDFNTDLYSIKDVYYNEENYSCQTHGSAEKDITLISIGILILLISVINYVNLSTARSSGRAKEIGVRKTIGASRVTLIKQFLGESIVICIISMLIAVLLASELVPLFNQLNDLQISMFSVTPERILIIFAAALVLGIAAGIYPAFYLTAIKTDLIIKGEIHRSSGKSFLRKSLIVIQFSITVVLLISALVIMEQREFVMNRPLGFQKDNIIYFQANNDILAKKDVFKSKVLQMPAVVDFAYSTHVPGAMGMVWGQELKYEGNQKKVWFTTVLTSTDFIRLMEMKIVAGRTFFEGDSNDVWNVLVNESFVKKCRLKDPFNATFAGLNSKGNIVGVVKDFNYKSLHSEVEPLAFVNYPDWFSCGIIKIKSSGYNDIKNVISGLQEIWKEVSPEFPFEYNFLDEKLALQYKSEERFEKAFLSFSSLAIFISCLGLFGLASFTVEQRVKEIGIRKVLGATISNIATLLSKQFVLLIIIANIIAWPAAYYLIGKWLEDFAYRIEISLWMFLLPGAVALIIALITVAFQTVKAARANPVESLKYE